MTWIGMVSAWAALLMGAMFAVNAYFQFATGVSGWVYAVTALLLLVGGFRTLRKMSGGLRLLAGAWGIAAGVLVLPFQMLGSLPPDYYARLDVGGFVLLCVSVVGLTLTVTHKETKKA